MPLLLKNIPTNVITGFLGVGKTTAILNLLKTKPADETWAVLVNEFGKVGIDGQLLKQDGIEIKEIPGGCMCCAAGVSMQVGLNALVARAKPDRLLIEPTGIGHPKQIIKQLSQPPFDQLLDMRACICLVDPRHLSDERYISNENYQQQLAIADVVVANKVDQASESDKRAFQALQTSHDYLANGWVEHGHLDAGWLNLVHQGQHARSLISMPAPTSSDDGPESISLQAGERCRRLENHDKEFYSCGWLIADDIKFSYESIIALLRTVDAERVKATIKTDQGNYAFNEVSSDINLSQRHAVTENRLEIISLIELDWQTIEAGLLNAMLPESST